MTVLPEYIDSRTMIVGHKREVQRGIVIKRIAPAETGDRMRKLAGIAQRLFVMMLIVPAMADEPNRAEPPPRITSTRSIMRQESVPDRILPTTH